MDMAIDLVTHPMTTGTHLSYPFGTALFIVGPASLRVGFLRESLRVTAMAMVLANLRVSVATTVAHILYSEDSA